LRGRVPLGGISACYTGLGAVGASVQPPVALCLSLITSEAIISTGSRRTMTSSRGRAAGCVGAMGGFAAWVWGRAGDGIDGGVGPVAALRPVHALRAGAAVEVKINVHHVG
jgi:hypothetical protein